MMRVTIACPEALIGDANQLALCLGLGSEDAQTYGAAIWQDVAGNRYALASAVVGHRFVAVAAAALPQTATQYGVMRIADAGGTIGMVKGADNRLNFYVGGSSLATPLPGASISGAPEVWTMQAKISPSQITIRRNGAQVASSTASQGTGLYPSGQMEIGGWSGGQWGPLRLYGLMMINRLLSPHELVLAERWAGSLCGVSI